MRSTEPKCLIWSVQCSLPSSLRRPGHLGRQRRPPTGSLPKIPTHLHTVPRAPRSFLNWPAEPVSSWQMTRPSPLAVTQGMGEGGREARRPGHTHCRPAPSDWGGRPLARPHLGHAGERASGCPSILQGSASCWPRPTSEGCSPITSQGPGDPGALLSFWGACSRGVTTTP